MFPADLDKPLCHCHWWKKLHNNQFHTISAKSQASTWHKQLGVKVLHDNCEFEYSYFPDWVFWACAIPPFQDTSTLTHAPCVYWKVVYQYQYSYDLNHFTSVETIRRTPACSITTRWHRWYDSKKDEAFSDVNNNDLDLELQFQTRILPGQYPTHFLRGSPTSDKLCLYQPQSILKRVDLLLLCQRNRAEETVHSWLDIGVNQHSGLLQHKGRK